MLMTTPSPQSSHQCPAGGVLLKAHLTATGQSVTAFASRLGVARTTLSRWMWGRMAIPLKRAAQIADLTMGEVPTATWARPAPTQPAAATPLAAASDGPLTPPSGRAVAPVPTPPQPTPEDAPDAPA